MVCTYFVVIVGWAIIARISSRIFYQEHGVRLSAIGIDKYVKKDLNGSLGEYDRDVIVFEKLIKVES